MNDQKLDNIAKEQEVAQIDSTISLKINVKKALYEYRLLNDVKFSDVTLNKMRDDFYKFYKKHILKCSFFISSNNLLNKRIIIRDEDNSHSPEIIKQSFLKTNFFQNKWLIDLIKEWPFFCSLSDADFTALIHKSQFMAFAFKISEFKVNGECYSVFEDNVWQSKKLMLNYYGEKTTAVSFKIHDKLNSLNLTERERALFYPFILSQCNEKNINDKRLFYYLKSFYTHVLFAEFFYNNRDAKFIENLNQTFEELSDIVNSFSSSFK